MATPIETAWAELRHCAGQALQDLDDPQACAALVSAAQSFASMREVDRADLAGLLAQVAGRSGGTEEQRLSAAYVLLAIPSLASVRTDVH